MARVGIALGSNLGDRLENLREAVLRCESLQCSDHRLLSIICETDPIDCSPDSKPFYNAVIEIETNLSPQDLLASTQKIEQMMGRPRNHGHNTPRVIDLDILYYDDLTLTDHDLILPHPRMKNRPFVLIPLATIRPDLVPSTASVPVDQVRVLSDLKLD